MSELEMLLNKSIPTDALGQLKIVTNILVYDYPRCFIAMDKYNNYYALLEVLDDEEFGWNVTKVTLDEINEVNRGTANVQSLFLDKTSYILIFSNSDIGHIIQVNNFEGEYEIKGDLYCPDFCDMDEVFDYHELNAVAKTRNRSSISIVYDTEHGINAGQVFRSINYIKSICDKAGNLSLDAANLYVKSASVVLTFEFPNDAADTLFYGNNEDDTYNQKLIRIGRLFEADSPEEILTIVENNGAIKKMRAFTKNMEKNAEYRPKVVFSAPQWEQSDSFAFYKEKCEAKKVIYEKAEDLQSEYEYTEKHKMKLRGRLTGILTGGIKNKFSFISNGNRIEGKVDSTLLNVMKGFGVNTVEYDADIEETQIKFKKQIKMCYKLLNLTKIREFSEQEQMEFECIWRN